MFHSGPAENYNTFPSSETSIVQDGSNVDDVVAAAAMHAEQG
jgi:hypothetical protein